jgi:carboxymethylenebutenolidase
MNARGEMVEIGASDGAMSAYVSRPEAGGPFPGVLVIMEAFGLNQHIKGVADRIAREGYVTLAPDLYYRSADGVAAYDDLPKALRLMGELSDAKIVADVGAAHGWLKKQPGVRAEKVGITGFCMGGRTSFLAACRLPLQAAAPFYGGGIGRSFQSNERTPHPPLDDAAGIQCPMVLFYGDEDGFIPLDEVELVKRRLQELGKQAEVVVYPGAEHGFFCDERPSYHAAAAQDSWKRLLKLFDGALKQ